MKTEPAIFLEALSAANWLLGYISASIEDRDFSETKERLAEIGGLFDHAIRRAAISLPDPDFAELDPEPPYQPSGTFVPEGLMIGTVALLEKLRTEFVEGTPRRDGINDILRQLKDLDIPF